MGKSGYYGYYRRKSARKEKQGDEAANNICFPSHVSSVEQEASTNLDATVEEGIGMLMMDCHDGPGRVTIGLCNFLEICSFKQTVISRSLQISMNFHSYVILHFQSYVSFCHQISKIPKKNTLTLLSLSFDMNGL